MTRSSFLFLVCFCGKLAQGFIAHESLPRSSSRVLLYSNADAYVLHWETLLMEEYQEAVAELKIQKRTWSRNRLQDAGLSLFDAFAEPESDLFGEKIVRISKEEARLRDKFSRGDVLVMTAVGRAVAKHQALPKDCCVVDVGNNWMTIAVGPAWPAGLWEARRVPNSYRVQLDRTAPRAPLTAQRQALQLVRQKKAGDMAQLLVDTFYSSNAVSKTCKPPLRFREWDSIELEQGIVWALKEATEVCAFEPNMSQRDAISWALGRRMSILQGPPGTGKTRVAALLIAAALRLHTDDSDVPPRVLAVAHSNGAADVLLEALLEVGVAAVRAGRPASVSANVRHRTVTAIADKHPEVVSLRQQGRNTTLESHVRSSILATTRECLQQVCDSILKTAPVVVASCIGAFQLVEDGSASVFPIVVVDEAAQTTEPALLCALAAAKAEQVIFVGDTRQLPPTIASESPKLRDSLGASPMARLEANGVDHQTLRVQYRMSPALLEHPSQYFYNGLVTCADTMQAASVPKGFPWPVPQLPLAFIQSGPNLEFAHESGGKSNPSEATLVVDVIERILQSGDVDATGVAVISPYAKQVQRIRTDLALRNIRNIRVGTVDSFQGQETDVVVFSAVRSNMQADIGFLRDPRRLCVTITRARRGLILIGDQAVLRTSRHWSALIDSCLSRGCLLSSEMLVPDTRVESVASCEATVQRQIVNEQLKDASIDWLDTLFDD